MGHCQRSSASSTETRETEKMGRDEADSQNFGGEEQYEFLPGGVYLLIRTFEKSCLIHI